VDPAPAREVYAGRIIRVEVLPRRGGDYDVVRHPGAAGVLPITPQGDVLLVRQLRPAIGQPLVEIPAGLLDVREEDALTCAARELLEETGYRHRTIEFLGGFFTSAGFCDEYVHLFVATTHAEPEARSEAEIELVRRPFAQMLAAARGGRVRDVKTALAILLADARGYGAP
jgi:ADP-ribose pyrophosphatase